MSSAHESRIDPSTLPCSVCKSGRYWRNGHAFSDMSLQHEEHYATILKRETLLRSWARNLLYNFVGYCAFQIWYFNSYAWKSTWTIGLYVFQMETGNSSFQDVPFSNEELWKKTVDRMVVLWDLVRKGGALSLPLPIALLQLSVVMGNAIMRTMAILAFLLAVSSLAAASFLMAFKAQMYSDSRRDRWLYASKCPRYLSSIDFWTRLSWPVTSFVWSILLSLVDVILLAVVSHDSSSTVDTKNLDVIVIFMGLILICVVSYRVFKFCLTKSWR